MKFHDRLDLGQDVTEYTDSKCGSVAASAVVAGKTQRFLGKPVYCCSECPTLQALLKAGKAGSFGLLA